MDRRKFQNLKIYDACFLYLSKDEQGNWLAEIQVDINFKIEHSKYNLDFEQNAHYNPDTKEWTILDERGSVHSVNVETREAKIMSRHL